MKGGTIFSGQERVGLQILLQSIETSSTSTSTSSVSQSSSSSEKLAYMCVRDGHKYEWFAFDVSNDIDHNQPAAPPLKYLNNVTRFHKDDDCGEANLKPKATLEVDRILDWTILDSKTLYILNGSRDDSRGPSNVVDHIDLSNPMAKWEPLFPRIGFNESDIQLSKKTLPIFFRVLSFHGKLYFLGPQEYGESERQSKSPVAKAYDLSVKEWNSKPRPPCLDLEKIFSAAIKVPETIMSSTARQLQRQRLWFHVFNPGPNKLEWDMDYLSIPDLRCNVDSIFSAAGHFPDPCIVVGSAVDGSLGIYHENTKEWEYRHHRELWASDQFMFDRNAVTGPALAVDSKLYWYSVEDRLLVAYDLMTRLWFLGDLPIHDHGEQFGVQDYDTPPRLAHLGGHKFCLMWVSVLPVRYRDNPEFPKSKADCISRLHCMTLQVNAGLRCQWNSAIPLMVFILSCQSYSASGLKSFCGGLVV